MTNRLSKIALVLAVLPLAVASIGPRAGEPATTVLAASEPGRAAVRETTQATATVTGVDAAHRIVTFKLANGRVVEMLARDDVRNFDQIHVGDKVHVEYMRAMSLELIKGGSGIRESAVRSDAVRAPAGAKPGGGYEAQVSIIANVVAVDYKGQFITLRGPKGNLVDLTVRDPKQLKAVKVGDQVEAVYSEAMAIRAESLTK